MIKFEDLETIFLLASFTGSLIFASPVLSLAFPSGPGEKLSELYFLGPNRMAEGYSFNVKAGETYSIFLGIGNHMGSSAYYLLYVKLRNQIEPLPNSTSSTPSSLPPLYEYRVFLSDGEVWESPLNFSFDSLYFTGESCSLIDMTINGESFHVDKAASWDPDNEGFFFELFFELWICSPEAKSSRFHNRFVGIWLNMTAQVD